MSQSTSENPDFVEELRQWLASPDGTKTRLSLTAWKSFDYSASLINIKEILLQTLPPSYCTAILGESRDRVPKDVKTLMELEKEGDHYLLLHGFKHPLPTHPGKAVEKDATIQSFRNATKASWERIYVGDGAKALFEHILRFYSPHDIKIYAHYLAVVNASGVGKSKAVDSLSETHFIISLCLRARDTSGYPPADHEVRDFLACDCEQTEAYARALVFCQALLEHTASLLLDPPFQGMTEYSKIAFEFRKLMTNGMQATQHNEFRRRFYAGVVSQAKRELASTIDKAQTSDGITIHASPSSKVRTKSTNGSTLSRPVILACQKLASILGRTVPPTRSKGHPEPLIILAFDEAHTMTSRKGGQDSTIWSNFSELRYVLRALNFESIFSVFLSTTGKISQFTSARADDTSRRVMNHQLVLIEPFCDLGLDAVACDRKLNLNGSFTLEEVTGDKFMSHLGRPLFGSHYDYGDEIVRRDLIEFAALKLLNQGRIPTRLTDTQSLACLSFRLPIEFNSTNYVAQATERNQVESHLRICLKIDAAFESMVTVSASEPFLSEAAYFVMHSCKMDVARCFKTLTEGFAIHQGDRGEYLAMLLFTLARDKTVGPPNPFGRPQSRSFKLLDFLNNLLVLDADPSLKQISKQLQRDFPASWMHFNHYIKLHEQKVITRNRLMLMLGRGAGVLCAANQTAVDFIHPFLLKGGVLEPSNFGTILVQVKNDASYTATVKQELFDQMDPRTLGILQQEDPAVPLIRIVLALAARRPSLTLVRHDPSDLYKAPVYDIWVAGLSEDIVGPIGYTANEETWKALLAASYGWKTLYNVKSEAQKNQRMSANPATAIADAHWWNWSEKDVYADS